MSRNHWQAGTAVLVALGMISGAAAPIVIPAPAFAQVSFYDVPSNHWAKGFIEALAARGIIKGFPDGSFRPNEPVTRAQFAAMVRQAFNMPKIRSAIAFRDVPSNFWAYRAIADAYEMGFMSGYPGNIFSPNENIPRVQVLVSLANGLQYTATRPTSTLSQVYNDAAAIPSYALNSIQAATEKGIVVNYPNVKFLNPNQIATRADVAAFIYQALVNAGQVAAISSPYIVSLAAPDNRIVLKAGTLIPVEYEKAEKILLAQNEPKPVPLTLTVARDIAVDNTVVIPADSKIVGELRVANNGAQFFAKELVYADGRRIPINADSRVVTKTERITKGINIGKVLKNAVLGAAAAAAIAAVTGDRAIATEEVLLGAGLGTVLTLIGVFQGRDQVDLISVDPNTDLNLTLRSDLVFTR
ncbi:MAG: S-layer homology domain-containing protein [Oscillatoriaceae bacterium SKW80]|nr:S-layer homology domain-containing protein [Oscillatoriaceae bacterium SKYG93]MCX8121404.1 S-layer homology domain-containing protein [Oscillatoriaceae bacterium SKW80]MDW8451919.1 S-layer homology domain-containing protein [Oscillatoriaceae cyanobacterium SKYGB_i_bin93]HIK29462.1 S-layer homology domain-containing protein [Oscillatoriaceae cyanobacterium M7585_C2015_266]